MAPQAESLVTVELRFRTHEDVQELGDRIREAVASIVGRDALEELRIRDLPLDAPKRPPLHPVD